MWSFLYQVPASAAALLQQFEQQTGQLSSPGTTCTLPQCSPLYEQRVREYSVFTAFLVREKEHNACMSLYGKSWWNQESNCVTGVPQFTRDVPSLELQRVKNQTTG